MAARQPPTPSDHAADRWAERADPVPDYEIDAIDDVDLWSAWADARPFELPLPFGAETDEARYHDDAKVVLCRQGSTIATVFDVVGDDATIAVRRAVELQLDINLGVSR